MTSDQQIDADVKMLRDVADYLSPDFCRPTCSCDKLRDLASRLAATKDAKPVAWIEPRYGKHTNSEGEKISIEKRVMRGSEVACIVIWDDSPPSGSGEPAPMLLDEGTRRWLAESIGVPPSPPAPAGGTAEPAKEPLQIHPPYESHDGPVGWVVHHSDDPEMLGEIIAEFQHEADARLFLAGKQPSPPAPAECQAPEPTGFYTTKCKLGKGHKGRHNDGDGRTWWEEAPPAPAGGEAGQSLPATPQPSLVERILELADEADRYDANWSLAPFKIKLRMLAAIARTHEAATAAELAQLRAELAKLREAKS